ncbi:unnamed protein product [Effrenium voratum]|nr:unnamed protein product [Effrenium voratum]
MAVSALAGPAAARGSGGGGSHGCEIFEPMVSVQARWPDLPDAEKLERIYDLYAISTSASVPWWDESGNPLMKPHPDNYRPHEQHIRKLEKKCLKYGIRPEIRGQPWALMSASNAPPYQMLSWGSLTRAAYRAASAEPHNEILKRSMSRPLTGAGALETLKALVILFHVKTPRDVTDFLRDFHNRWTDAQTNFDGDYPSKNCFEDAKALANFLATKHWSAAFQSFLDAITMFDDSRLDTVTAITCLQEWSVILQKYQDSIPADAHLQLFLEGSRFMVPSVSEDCDLPDCSVPTSKRVPMVFTKIDKDTLRLVSTPMGSSLAYNPPQNGAGKSAAKAKSGAAKGKRGKADDNPDESGKRRKKAVAGSSGGDAGIDVPEERLSREVFGGEITMSDHVEDAQALTGDDAPGLDSEGPHDAIAGSADFQAVMCMGNIFLDTTSAPNSAKKREKTFLDDLLAVFNHVVQSQKSWLFRKCYEKPLLQIRSIVFSLGLEFCFEGTVQVSGKPFKCWSALRVALRDLIVGCLSKIKAISDTLPTNGEPNASAAATIATAVSKVAAANGVTSAAVCAQGWGTIFAFWL